MDDASGPVERVWSQLPAGARQQLVERLSPTDLQSLLLDLASARAKSVTPRRLVRRWAEDRFSRPANIDPRRRVEIEAALWRLLPPEFAGVTLSPLSPLGACSAIAPVHQNRVVSTVRTSEVTSDPTNALALEAAARRQGSEAPVHLAACTRVVRAQQFANSGSSAHFELFALVSSGRDTGAHRTEAQLLAAQLGFMERAVGTTIGPVDVRLDVTFIDDPVMRERWHDSVLPTLLGLAVREWPERTAGIGYYRSLAFKVIATDANGDHEIGDGGFVDWTAQLRSDAKERCLISCLATERLATLAN